MRSQERCVRGAAVVGVLAFVLWPAVASAQPEPVWEASGFEHPESVLFDPERDIFYVSNVNGAPTEKDGNGYISRLSRDGQVEEAQWVTGLDAPKGMALADGRLYVADIDRLVVIDVAEGAVVDTYPAEGAQFLNDVTADSSGRVFVSDMATNKIHILEDGRFTEWLQDAALTSPNGLLAEEDRLVVASWGETTEAGQPKTPSDLKTVDYEDKTVSDLRDGEPVGNLDGLEATAEGNYLVTDWAAGALFRIDPAGEAERLLDLNQGSADLEYLPEDGLAIVPMMMDGTVVAYRLG